MPELPEMETYKTLLTRLILNRTVSEVQINREKSVNVPVHDFLHIVRNSRIADIRRRGKMLIFALDRSDMCLLLHLMLGGWMFYGEAEEKPRRTAQVQLGFGRQHLYFMGLRLGYLHVLSSFRLEEHLGPLGPEPLGEYWNESVFAGRVLGKRGMLKTVLTDQHVVAGIGNCYSDEICFAAGLLPARKCHQLTEDEQAGLYRSIVSVLREGIQFGGYMEHPLYSRDTFTGGYNFRLKVYDREGETCFRCGGVIQKMALAGRKTFYCPGCQL
jgi:formamidopyrimidine-DNA glycosylase